MRKKIFVIIIFISFSIFVFSQADRITIKSSDFRHYLDCQKLDNYKRDNGDTLRIDKSFLFDTKGNLLRKLKDNPWEDPLELTTYSYNNKILVDETKYKTTCMDNVFDSNQRIYFYNKNGLIDSEVVINSYPYFNFEPIDEKADSLIAIKNIVEFDEPILTPIDSSFLGGFVIMKDGKRITGYKKVKKEASLIRISIDTSTTCRYYYNNKEKRINELFGSDDWNISERTIIDYDKMGRLSTVLCYAKNSYKLKDQAEMDSLNLWMKAHLTNGLSKEDALIQVAKWMKEEMSDTLLKYNTEFAYNKDGSTTETAVHESRINKLTIYRNKNGQIVKSIKTNIGVHNKYENGRFIPTDITTLQYSDFSFFETTTNYEYDSLGRIIKCTQKYLDNDNGEKKEYQKSENFTIYKYNSNLPLKLPESEYVERYTDYHRYYLLQKN
jgi:hypothetical protein